jgi:hypothetical protein
VNVIETNVIRTNVASCSVLANRHHVCHRLRFYGVGSKT